MKTPGEIASTLLNLSEREFFADDSEFLWNRKVRLLDIAFEGVAINAPRTVDTAMRTKLPVVMGIRMTGTRASDVPETEHVLLCATDLDTGEVRLARAFFDRKAAEFGEDEPPPGRERYEGDSAQVRLYDARERLNLPWKTATLSVCFLCYDWVSNVVPVALTGPDAPEKGVVAPIRPEPDLAPPEKKRLFGKAKANLPCFRQTAQSPPAPSEGLAVRVDEETFAENRLLPIHGAFTTVARPRHILGKPVVHAYSGAGEARAVAVVPVTMIVLSLGERFPRRIEWGVPVYGAGAAAAGTPLTGYFSLDALSGAEPPLGPGRYVAHFLLEGTVLGPLRFEVPAPR
jgi:hypothetical protein